MSANPRKAGWRAHGVVEIAILLVMMAFPMLWAFGYSVAYGLGGIGLLSDGWTLRHWNAALAGGGLAESLVFSLIIAVGVTLVTSVCSLGFVLWNPDARNSRWLLALLCLPLATPSAVAAVIADQWLSSGGILSRFAFHTGWIDSPSDFPALVNDRWAIGIALTLAVNNLAMLTLFLFKTWQSARVDQHCQVAESLGASRWQVRRRVALPLLLRRARPIVLLVFLFNLGSFEIPLLLGRQAPQMFSVLTQRRFGQFDLAQRPMAFVLATTYFTIVSVVLWKMLSWRERHG